MRQMLGVALLFFFALQLPAQTGNSEQADYAAAASKVQATERLSALERFLLAHPQSALKLDALELLVWNSRTSGSIADLEHWTTQLLATSPDNPLAAAIMIGSSLPIGPAEPPADRAKRAIGALDHFDRPEGFSHADFSAMKNFVVATLNGVVGYSYFEQKDFAAARPYLRKAVELAPNNAQLTYTLALSDLQGDKTEQAEGFKYLARSVNLTKGTPAGESLAQYARQQYRDVGGIDSDWDKYLVNTAVPARPVEQPAAPVVASAPTPKPAPTTTVAAAPSASTPVANRAPASTTATSPSSSTPTSTTSVVVTAAAPSTAATNSSPAPNSTSAPVASTAPTSPTPTSPTASSSSAKEVAMATPPPPPPANEPTYRVIPPRRIPELTKGAPMSVGLLIQSALAQKQTRQPIVFSLTDLVRRMRQNDEAFVMSFSRGLAFQEDLTSNDKALESAMDSIAPEPGAAIYDAVTFAAGHLNRIARNKNRVLVVISGEGDRNSGVSPLELSSELNVSGVRIYCIGLDVYSQSDQARLQQLAGYTGGRAFFIHGPDQIRGALQSISSDLGIPY
jgi:tetratricopeptide (TPR) repeat protein